MKRKPILYAGAFAVAIVLVLSLMRETTRAPIHVTYARVTTGPVAREVFTTGTLEPAQAVDVGSQVSGTIQTLDADFNSRVKKGQIIARLDPSLYDLEVTQARAALIKADAALAGAKMIAEDAKVKLERGAGAGGTGAHHSGGARCGASRIGAGGSRGQSERLPLRLATAGSTEAEVTRARTIIRSPIDGVVINRAVEIGQTLAASFQSPVLFTIADLRQMRLIAEVSEGDVGGVRPGTPVTFELSSLDGEQFEGTVTEVRLQPIATLGNTTTPATGAAATSGTAASGDLQTLEAPPQTRRPERRRPRAWSAVLSTPATHSCRRARPRVRLVPSYRTKPLSPVANPDGRLPPGRHRGGNHARPASDRTSCASRTRRCRSDRRGRSSRLSTKRRRRSRLAASASNPAAAARRTCGNTSSGQLGDPGEDGGSRRPVDRAAQRGDSARRRARDRRQATRPGLSLESGPATALTCRWPSSRGTRRSTSSWPSSRAAAPSPRSATAASGPCAGPRRG